MVLFLSPLSYAILYFIFYYTLRKDDSMEYEERIKDIRKLGYTVDVNTALLWCRHGSWLLEQADKVKRYEQAIAELEHAFQDFGKIAGDNRFAVGVEQVKEKYNI